MTITPPAAESMAHLDFREALSTPEERILSPQATAVAIPAASAIAPLGKNFLRGLGLSRSAMANIVFVAIASFGGLVCAFYFFNGAEVLRAAASWPSEYLYPRPLSAEKSDIVQPNPVDQYSASNSVGTIEKNDASKNNDAQNFTGQPAFASNLTPPSTSAVPPIPPIPPINPGPVPPSPIVVLPPPPVVPPDPIVILPPPPVVPPPASLFGQVINDMNTVSPGSGTTARSLYHTVASTAPAGAAVRTTKSNVKSAKRKVAATKQKVVTTATSTRSAVRGLQQTTSQTQVTQMTQMSQVQTTTAAAAPVNPVMSSGGMGGVSGLGGGIIGAGTGTGTGTGAGTGGGAGSVGGTVTGLGGGLSGGGLGGTISGVGGSVGGIVGGHH